jgi:hypothetical protein
MMPWSPAPSSLLLDLGVLPVEAGLLVADLLDRVAGDLLEMAVGDGVGAAHLAGQHDAVGRHKRLDRDARIRLGGEIGIDHRVRNPVADLVGMTLGNGFAGEQVVAACHSRILPHLAAGARSLGKGARRGGRPCDSQRFERQGPWRGCA